MTNQPTSSSGARRAISYPVEEMQRLREQGTATALFLDVDSPVLLSGAWWAVHEADPTGHYRPVQLPGATKKLDEMAARLIDASNALAALDVEGAGFLPATPEEPE